MGGDAKDPCDLVKCNSRSDLCVMPDCVGGQPTVRLSLAGGWSAGAEL